MPKNGNDPKDSSTDQQAQTTPEPPVTPPIHTETYDDKNYDTTTIIEPINREEATESSKRQ